MPRGSRAERWERLCLVWIGAMLAVETLQRFGGEVEVDRGPESRRGSEERQDLPTVSGLNVPLLHTVKTPSIYCVHTVPGHYQRHEEPQAALSHSCASRQTFCCKTLSLELCSQPESFFRTVWRETV